MTRSGVVALMVLALLAAWTGEAGAQLATYEKSELVIETAKGPQRFTVEMAVTPEQKTQGLMFRTSLPSDAGMLFDYQLPQPVSMWMRNTLIPLDMLFIGADGRVVNVRE